jgi:hypothetical protein
MKTAVSKVKDVQGAGNFTNEHGTFNTFEYEFEDGTIMKANHKNGSFNQGDEVEYTIKREHPDFGCSGSVKKPQEAYAKTAQTTQQNGNKDNEILFAVCLKASAEILARNSISCPESHQVVAYALEMAKTSKAAISEL